MQKGTKTAKSTMARAFPPLYSHKLNKIFFDRHCRGGGRPLRPPPPLNPPLGKDTNPFSEGHETKPYLGGRKTEVLGEKTTAFLRGTT